MATVTGTGGSYAPGLSPTPAAMAEVTPMYASGAVYVAMRRRRIRIAAAAKTADGIQIQTSSLARTRAPHSLKNARTLIGDT